MTHPRQIPLTISGWPYFPPDICFWYRHRAASPSISGSKLSNIARAAPNLRRRERIHDSPRPCTIPSRPRQITVRQSAMSAVCEASMYHMDALKLFQRLAARLIWQELQMLYTGSILGPRPSPSSWSYSLSLLDPEKKGAVYLNEAASATPMSQRRAASEG